MSTLLTYLFEASICIALVWIFFKLVLEKLTFFDWNRGILLGMLGLAMIIPLLSFNFLPGTSLPMQEFTLPTFTVGNEIETVNAFSWQEIILVVYLVGLGIMTNRLIREYFRSLAQIRQAEKHNFQGFTLAVDPRFQPATFFNYVLLPEFRPEDEDQQQIILHESVHVSKNHTWDLVLIQIAKAVFWFNPLIYIFERSLREIHEYQADQGVTESYSPIEYSRLLLRLIVQEKQLQLTHHFNQFQTKKRIVMMNKPKSETSEKSRFLFAIPVLALMAVVFSCEITPEPELEGPAQMGEKATQVGPANITARLNDVGTNADEIFDVVENPPQPIGGMSGWNQYLSDNLQYPEQARSMGIEGTVIAVFVVQADGSITDVDILRGIGGGCDEAAIRVIENAPNWEPGTQRDKVVNTRMRVPIRFQLGSDADAK